MGLEPVLIVTYQQWALCLLCWWQLERDDGVSDSRCSCTKSRLFFALPPCFDSFKKWPSKSSTRVFECVQVRGFWIRSIAHTYLIQLTLIDSNISVLRLAGTCPKLTSDNHTIRNFENDAMYQRLSLKWGVARVAEGCQSPPGIRQISKPYSNQGGRCPSHNCQPPRIQKTIYTSGTSHAVFFTFETCKQGM